MTTYHIAQANFARALAPLDGPVMAGFVSRLAEINTLADAAPGFVWRLQDDTGDATSIHVWDDPNIILNLSVWETIEHWHAFAYRGPHAAVMRQRASWFERLSEVYSAMWWVPAGTVPAAAEARVRIEHLRDLGPTPYAFNYGHRFPPPDSTK